MKPFSILFVCTGNICRSPLAERLLRARLHEASDEVAEAYAVQSAGLGALVDHPMDPDSAKALADLGGDGEGHLARRITEQMVRDAGLVLTAEERQRSRVLQDSPAALRRTFTLREFASLCALVGDDVIGMGAEDLVRHASARRGSAQVDDYDIPDPYRRTAAEHAAAAELILEAVDMIAPVLARAVAVSR